MKIIKTVIALIAASFAVTGCQTLKEDAPLAYALAKATAQGLLVNEVNKLNTDETKREALKEALQLAFTENVEPEDVAAFIIAKTELVITDTEALQVLLSIYQAALLTADLPPASGPQKSYLIDLAEALL